MLKVLLFAHLAERGAGQARNVPTAATPRGLVDAHRDLEFLKDRSLRVAVNRCWAHWDTPLADGDEVAFLPPASAF